jgi:branched-subunit amino acid transport protein
MTGLWITLIIIGLLTFLTRLSFIVLFGRWQPPAWLQRALRFVPPAVLTAIIFPELLMRDGQLAVWPLNPRLLAGVLAGLVAWRTKSALLTILSGMLALYLIQWVMG